jgi:large subunit ribosomal protein L6
MSRIGKNPVMVPDGTQVTIDGHIVSAKGKLGELSIVLTADVEISQADNQITVMPRSKTKRAQMMWGTSRNLIDNLVTGVTTGYSKTLDINGVGYRAAVQGRMLTLQLGYSHDVEYPIPEGIDIKCESPTIIVVSGADKQRVGQVSAEIRSYRKPEPYKGKGIRYRGEIILRKEGKKK